MSLLKTPDKKLTRIAPTPSGYLHAGNAFSFVITALVAHLEGADILLRIDDLDRKRYRRYYADDIFRTLELLGIDWQHGPKSTTELENEWSQFQRMEIYRDHLERLSEDDRLFACECSRKEVYRRSDDAGYAGTCRSKNLSFNLPNTAIRLRTDQRGIHLKLWPEGVTEDALAVDMRDFVLRRKDGIPAYQLASVVDDLHFGVNLIVRGADLYPSSLAQVFLAEELCAENFLDTRFFHHELVKSEDGKKLSKSAGAQAVDLKSKASFREMYRQFSRWLSLEDDAEDLEALKRLISFQKLKRVGISQKI